MLENCILINGQVRVASASVLLERIKEEKNKDGNL